MSLRTIRLEGDEILRKKSKEVKEMTPRLKTLVDDMLDTMYEYGGVGLAAPQVGILKQIVVIDVGEGPCVLVNPKITARSGSQIGMEAFDVNMREFTLTGTELLARAICHECEHLEGGLYIDQVEGELVDDEDDYEEE